MHRAIALPLAAIMLALMLNAAAAQDAPPSDPIPTPTSTDAAPQRPDDAPPSDAVAGADAAAVRVYLPLVVRPNPLFDLYPPVNRAWEEEFIRLLTRNASATDCTRSASTRSSPSPPAAMRMTSASTRCRAAIAAADAGTGAPTARSQETA
jgi:hypothetical protein